MKLSGNIYQLTKFEVKPNICPKCGADRLQVADALKTPGDNQEIARAIIRGCKICEMAMRGLYNEAVV